MNHSIQPSVLREDSRSSVSSLSQNYIPQETLEQISSEKQASKNTIIKTTKGAVAAVLGGVVLVGNVSATDMPASQQNALRDTSKSATTNLAGINTTQDIQLNFGNKVKAAEAPAIADIPAGVSEAEWNNPNINTKEGFLITLSKLTKKPVMIYEKVKIDFDKLNDNELGMLQLAFLNSENATCSGAERAGAIWRLAQALLQDRNAQVVVNEFKTTKYLTLETLKQYTYDDSVVMTAVNLTPKIGEGAMRTSGLDQIVSKEKCEARIQQINEIYTVVNTQNKQAITQLDQMGKMLNTMSGK